MSLRPSIALLAVLGLAACGDPTSIRATLSTVTDTLSVYPLTGTPLELPNALKTVASGFPFPRVVRATGELPFDVAFDMTAGGQLKLLPVRLITPAVTRRVGIQTSDSAFATLSRAPRTGYEYDSVAVTFDVGETVVIETTESNYCFSDIGKTIFTKLVVDSVRPDKRIFFRTVVDPNCGFRSFLPGVPGS